jgi:hypothetical protein
MMEWIDELTKIWAFSDERFGTVRSYKVIEKAEFPLSIDPKDLATSPIAITLPAALRPEYSAGGPTIGFWRGITEFHVAPDVDKKRLPSIMRWYRLILAAAAGNMKLNGTCELFLLADIENAIDGPMGLQYGTEAEHWGFIVSWQVKERLEGQFTVSA